MKDPGTASTWLFVPGSRPDRFATALGSGADQIIVDLEDAVPAAEKDRARIAAVDFLADHAGCTVRINGADTPWFADDVAAIRGLEANVMLPKAEPASVHAVTGIEAPLIGLVETARGVNGIDAVAAAADRIALGNADLAAELGVDPSDRRALDHVRGRLVVASAAYALPAPIDGVTLDLADHCAAAADAREAARLGFSGKLCVHPAQLAPTREGFRPDDAVLAWARRVLEQAGEGATSVDGQMIDAPVIARARSVLDRAQ